MKVHSYSRIMEEAERAETESQGRPRRANDLDVTGRTVAANVRRLRRELDLTTKQLADRVTECGRPMLPNAITKIEQMQRRVDADDLSALAVALGVTPNALLLPPGRAGEAYLTGLPKKVTPWLAWAWACGELSLHPSWDPTLAGADLDDPEILRGHEDRFRRLCAPHHEDLGPRAVEQYRVALDAVVDAVKAVGLEYEAVARWAAVQAAASDAKA